MCSITQYVSSRVRHSIPLILLEASQWKRRLHLPKDKEAARQWALQLFPPPVDFPTAGP
jgi:hypothetical protein